MAIINRPDYSFQGQVPTAAIIQAYQQKAMAEEESRQKAAAAKEQKWVDIAKMVQSGADMVNKFTEQSKQKMQADAKAATSALLAQSGDQRTLMTPAQSSLFPSLTKAPVIGDGHVLSQDYSQTPEYKAELASLVAKGWPDEFGKQGVKTALEQIYPSSGDNVTGGRYQQSQIQRPDPETGQMRTYSVTFDKTSGQLLNPSTLQPLVSEDDYAGLHERGYAQGMRKAGQTIEGHEVVADLRTGAKYVVTMDENGQKTTKPYNGILYPDLANAPASAQEALGNLQIANDTLKAIRETYKPAFVGPIAAKYKTVAQYVESLTDEEQVAFKTELQTYQNAAIKAITGAQMSEPEAVRLLRQMPDDSKSPKAFIQMLEVNERVIQRQAAAKLGTLEAGRSTYGKSVSEERLRELMKDRFKNLDVPENKGSDLSSVSTDDLLRQLAGGK